MARPDTRHASYGSPDNTPLDESGARVIDRGCLVRGCLVLVVAWIALGIVVAVYAMFQYG